MSPGGLLSVACAALLVVCTSAGADEAGVQPVEPVVEQTATIPDAQPTPTPAPEASAVAAATPVPSPAAHAAPAPSPAATAAAPPAPAATPVPAAPAATARRATAQPTPTATPAPAPALPVACTPPGESSRADECALSPAVCSILGTEGDDVLVGTPLDDFICGLGGDDQLHGGDGSDVLLGGNGDDVLVGGEGDDCVDGGPGDDAGDAAPEDSFVDVDRWPRDTGEVGQPVELDPEGNCFHPPTPAPGAAIPRGSSPPIVGAQSAVGRPSADVPAAAAEDGLRMAVSGGKRAVRDGVVRIRVSCSATVSAELVLWVGSRRIGRKRFECTRPARTVRVRLNDAGRSLVARDGRVRARVLVLGPGRTFSGQVLLVGPGG